MATSASVPGSGTGATAPAGVADAGTAPPKVGGKYPGVPTYRSVPSSIPSLLVTIKVPPSTNVPPLYIFVPLRVSVPVPVCSKAIVPAPGPSLIVPAKVPPPLATPVVSVIASDPLFCIVDVSRAVESIDLHVI